MELRFTSKNESYRRSHGFADVSRYSLLATRYSLLAAMFIATNAFAGDAPFFKGDVQSPQVEMGLPKIEQKVGFDQHLGQQVTLSLPVRDENGTMTTLGSYFGHRPVILVMAYYGCPNLCTMVMNGVFSGMKTLSFVPGKDFDVVSVSINPRETSALAMEKKNTYLTGFHESDFANGFHFLTASQTTIDELCKEDGFRYVYDSASDQYAHASGIMMLTPDGKISRYFFGVQFAPNDLKYGLMDASGGKIGSLTDKFLLYCCKYDPETGKYVWVANTLRVGGTLMILAMGTMFYLFYRRSRKVKLATHA